MNAFLITLGAIPRPKLPSEMPETRDCEVCGTQFIPNHYAPYAKYHSDECRTIAQRRKTGLLGLRLGRRVTLERRVRRDYGERKRP